MKIVNCGYDYRHPSDFRIYRPHGSGDCILLILRTPAQFELSGTTQLTKSNSVILYQKDTPQIYGACAQEFINDWVHFEADEEDLLWFDQLALPFDRVIPMDDVHRLSGLIRNMCGEKYSDHQNAEASAELYFRLLLMKISDWCGRKVQPNQSLLFEKLSALRQEIYSAPQKNWSIEALAHSLSVSLSYLQHQYKAFFGTNIKADITESRVEYAKYLLFGSDYTVSAISRMCGYENDVHFMRVFKDRTGLTPTAYRKQAAHSKERVTASRTGNPFCL